MNGIVCFAASQLLGRKQPQVERQNGEFCDEDEDRIVDFLDVDELSASAV